VDDPGPGGLVVGGQVAALQPEGDLLAGPGVEAELGEALELAGWLGGGGREREVELDDLGPGAGAGVGDLDGDVTAPVAWSCSTLGSL
jgi:hypothetical protein